METLTEGTPSMVLGLRQRRLLRGIPRPFRAARFRPRVELLEDRRLLAIVTSLLDNGAKDTLRYAINNYRVGDAPITFASNLSGTVQLTQGPLVINQSMALSGGELPGQITISGGGVSGVFIINAPNVQLARLTIADGLADLGGGIVNHGKNTFVGNCVFIGNTARTGGGAIFNDDSFFASDCRFVDNKAPTGAAVFSPGSGNLSSSVVSGGTAGNAIVSGPTFAINDVFLATPAEITATVGVPFTRVVATFTTLGPLPDLASVRAFIDWGDQGEFSTPTPEFDPVSRVFRVVDTRAYGMDTTYPIRVAFFGLNFFVEVQASAAVLTPGQSTTLTGSDTDTALPGDEVLAASSPGVRALLLLGDTDANPPATLFVGTFAGNPERVPSDGIVFYDVRVTDVPTGSVLFVSFRYPSTIGTLVNLKFFDPATRTFRLVQSPLIANDTVNHVLTVLINDWTLPSLAMMGHTVFTIAIAPPPQEVQQLVSPALASFNTTRTGLPAGIPTTFSSSTPVTLTLTPLQQSQLTVSQATVGPAITATVTSVGSEDFPYKWVWDLFHLEDMLQWFRQTPGKTEEAMPQEQPEEMPQESLLDLPLPMGGEAVLAATGFDLGYDAEAPDLLPTPVADATSDSFRLACIGLAFAGAVGMCAERRRPRMNTDEHGFGTAF